MTVAELGQRMSSVEFGDWKRYAVLEPFGPLADGAAAAWFANVNRDRKVRPAAILAAEALTVFDADPEPPRLPTPAELRAKLTALVTTRKRRRKSA